MLATWLSIIEMDLSQIAPIEIASVTPPGGIDLGPVDADLTSAGNLLECDVHLRWRWQAREIGRRDEPGYNGQTLAERGLREGECHVSVS